MRHFVPLLTLTAALAAAAPAAAQGPTITQADMPVPGDTLRLSRGLTVGVDFLATGPNHTWNYATLTPTRQRVATFLGPTSAGGLTLFTFGALGGANRASVSTPTQLPLDSVPGGGGLMLSDLRAYYRRQTADFRQVGYSASINGTAIPVTFTTTPVNKQDVVYRFPLSFASAKDSSRSYFEANIPNSAFLSQDQNRVNHVDGWGSLTTPFGTFQTIRVRTRLDAFDSLAIAMQTPIALQLPTRYEYKWLAVGQHVPLLTIGTAVVAGAETITGVEYRDIPRVIVFPPLGIRAEPVALAGFSVSPNPAAPGQPLALRGLPAGPATVDVLDALGRHLLTRVVSGSSSPVTLSAADLGTVHGILTVRITTAHGTAVRRLVRE